MTPKREDIRKAIAHAFNEGLEVLAADVWALVDGWLIDAYRDGVTDGRAWENDQ